MQKWRNLFGDDSVLSVVFSHASSPTEGGCHVTTVGKVKSVCFFPEVVKTILNSRTPSIRKLYAFK